MKNKRWFFWIVIVLAALTAGWYFFMRPGGIQSEPIDAISSNALIVIEAKNLSTIENNFYSSPQWNDLRSIKLLHDLEAGTQLLNNFSDADPNLKNALTTAKIVASAITVNTGNAEYIFACKTSGYSLKKLTWTFEEKTAEVQSYSSNKEMVFTYKIPGIKVSCAMVGNLFLFSTSAVLVESAISQIKAATGLNTDIAFKNIYNQNLKDTVPKVFINLEQFGFYASSFLKKEYYKSTQQLAKFTSWISMDLKFSELGIAVSGYAGSSKLNTVLSAYTSAEFNFDDADNFLIRNTAFAFQGNSALGVFENKKNTSSTIKSDWGTWLGTSFTYAISQPYDASLNNKSYIIMQVIDEDLALKNLSILSEKSSSNYNQYVIYTIPESEIMHAVSGFDKGPQTVYASVVQGYVLISASINQLMNVIDAYINQQTLKQDKDYANLKLQVSSNCNYSVYLNPALMSALVQNTFASDSANAFPFQKYSGLLMRFSSTKNMHIVSGDILYASKAKQQSGIAWKTQIDNPVLNGPYTVFNHISGKENIFLQDTALQLYLISPEGSIEWKRKLNAPMTDKIYTIDFYKNGKKQILFAATDGIHLLDMLGRDVEGFPISVTTEVTSPLAVIDYDGKGDYRMFIGCQNGNIYGYYKDGKPLPGWSPLKKSGVITDDFTYVVINQKDYILYSNTEGIINLKNRKGENRIKSVKNDFALVTALIPDELENTNQLFAIDKQYNLLQITLDGKITSTGIGKETKDATLVDIDKDNKTDLIYLTYDALIAETIDKKPLWSFPIDNTDEYKIYTYSNTKNVYFGIINPQLQKFFLIQSDGTLTNGFPVEASGDFIVIENGNLVVSSTGNFVVAYNIQ
ncbi:MAG TPA: DUF3352 domain-containing protein [Chitinophagales bacterium]|nr:DUF3352 domain-containing protein [Chitinophagales bacterium]